MASIISAVTTTSPRIACITTFKVLFTFKITACIRWTYKQKRKSNKTQNTKKDDSNIAKRIHNESAPLTNLLVKEDVEWDREAAQSSDAFLVLVLDVIRRHGADQFVTLCENNFLYENNKITKF